MQARRLAEFVARKEAFYKAQTMALDEAKKKIEVRSRRLCLSRWVGR